MNPGGTAGGIADRTAVTRKQIPMVTQDFRILPGPFFSTCVYSDDRGDRFAATGFVALSIPLVSVGIARCTCCTVRRYTGA